MHCHRLFFYISPSGIRKNMELYSCITCTNTQVFLSIFLFGSDSSIPRKLEHFTPREQFAEPKKSSRWSPADSWGKDAGIAGALPRSCVP